MAADLTDRIREIADARGVSESAVLEQAVERGLQAIWEETVLTLYVAGDLDRAEAVDRVGEQAVHRTDREVEAVEQDVEWGTKA
jgi:predicted transcriptional regulator